MNVLVDTNVLARMAQPGHPQHTTTVGAVTALRGRGDSLRTVPQVLYEFWVVATRPVSVNGLGLTAAQAAGELARGQTLFPVLPDTAAVYPEWERVVTTRPVLGKGAHDARLVAAMAVHGVAHILTFNTSDFTRYPGVTAIDPAAP